MTILLPIDFVRDKTFSNYAVAVYCALHEITVPIGMKSQSVNQHQLYYILAHKTTDHRKLLDYIRCGLNELIDNDVIEEIEEVYKQYVVDCSKLWIDTKNTRFIAIDSEEVYKIFQIENVNNFMLLRYFIYLIGTISSQINVILPNRESKNHVVGNVTVEYLMELSGISKKTLIEYNKLLEENELIYVYRQNDFTLDKEDSLKKLSNVYGRFKDKEFIDCYGLSLKKQNNSYKFVNGHNSQSNNKRKLAQRYIQIAKGKDEKYSEEEIYEVYRYVVSENKKYENMYKKNEYSVYLNKIRDLSVFEKYDFIKIEE